MKATLKALGEVYSEKIYRPLRDQDGPPDAGAVGELLLREGLSLLDELLAQKEEV